MALALDHIVQIVADLGAAQTALGAMGLRAVAGGRHTQWGTRNAVCHLGLPYIELLALEDRQVARTSPFGRAVLSEADRGDGIWRLALRTGDIERSAQAVREAGFRCAGPEPGRRQRPDGSIVQWSLAFPELPDSDLATPMLIDWHEPDRRRLANLIGLGIAEQAPRALIACVAVACRDPQATADFLHRALGLAVQEVTTQSYGSAWRASLRGGDIVLCGGPGAPPAVQDALAQRGERPFAVHLRAGSGDAGGEVHLGGAHYTFASL